MSRLCNGLYSAEQKAAAGHRGEAAAQPAALQLNQAGLLAALLLPLAHVHTIKHSYPLLRTTAAW
jgi:hypothetical protein